MVTESIFLGLQVAMWIALPLIGLGFILAIRGRVDLLTGMYLAVIWQIPPVLELGLANVSVVWVLLPLLILAGAVYLQKARPTFKNRRVGLVIGWLIAWGFWMTSLLVVFPIEGANWDTLISIIVLHFAIPFSALALFVGDIQRLRNFAIAFVVINLAVTPHTLSTLFGVQDLFHLFQDIATTWWQINPIYVNYHAIGRVAAVSVLLIVVLLADGQTKSRLARWLLVLSLVPMTYLLIISTSRQYILGIAVTVPFMIWWLSRGQTRQKGPILFTFILIGGIALWFFNVAPDYFRLTELSVSENDVAFLAYRPAIYSQMWEMFVQSPLFGNGLFYETTMAHNVVLDVLVAQGLPGLFFLIGAFVFIMRCIRGTLQGTPHNGIDVWRMAALLFFVLGLISAFVSGGVLTSDVMYVGGLLIWLLSPLDSPVVVNAQYQKSQLAQFSAHSQELPSLD